MKESYEAAAGPFFVLTSVSLILFGVFIAQAYHYWSAYKDDSRQMKHLVASLCCVETLHASFCLHLLWTYLVANGGDISALDRVVWSAGATVYIEAVIACMTEGLYIYRLWHLSKKNILVMSIPFLILLSHFCLGSAAASLTFEFGTWSEYQARKSAKIVLNCALVSGALIDLVTTVMLIYYLIVMNSGFPQTQHIVRTLITYAINTGAITTIGSLTGLFMFNFVQSNLMFFGMGKVVSKVYANVMLAVLNGRQKIKDDAFADRTIISIPMEFRVHDSSGVEARFSSAEDGVRRSSTSIQGLDVVVEVHTPAMK